MCQFFFGFLHAERGAHITFFEVFLSSLAALGNNKRCQRAPCVCFLGGSFARMTAGLFENSPEVWATGCETKWEWKENISCQMDLCSLIMRNQHPAKWICREIPWSCSLPWSQWKLSLIWGKGTQAVIWIAPLQSSSHPWVLQGSQSYGTSCTKHPGTSSVVTVRADILELFTWTCPSTALVENKLSLPLKETSRPLYLSFSVTTWHKIFLEHLCPLWDQQTGLI